MPTDQEIIAHTRRAVQAWSLLEDAKMQSELTCTKEGVEGVRRRELEHWMAMHRLAELLALTPSSSSDSIMP